MSDEESADSRPKRPAARARAKGTPSARAKAPAARARAHARAEPASAQPTGLPESPPAPGPAEPPPASKPPAAPDADGSPRRTRRSIPPRNGADAEDGAVLVTGICGRMGRLLVRQLHRSGPVVGIDRRPFTGKPADIVHHQLELRRRKARDVFRAGGIRAVVHLGTMHNLRESDRAHHSFNVVGFQKLLEYLDQYRVPKLVVLSSASLYGPSPENPQFLTEDAPLLGAQEFSQIRDLVEVDMLAQSFFWKHPDVETVILRPCHIMGRTRNAPSNYARMDRPITVMGFDPMLQVIHERDVTQAITLALQPGVRGVYNLRGPGELSVSRMLRMLGKTPMPVPGPLLKGVLSRLWSYRAGSFPTPELDHLRYVCMVDDSRARRDLGFQPRYDLAETLRAVTAER